MQRNNEKYLAVRLHPEVFEMSAVFVFDTERPRSKHLVSVTKKKRAKKFLWGHHWQLRS